MTDEDLVARARGGDADAFDQLVGRHQAAVYRATLAALRVPEDAEEAAQDAFVRAWSGLDRFRGDASFRTWLLTIAWNVAIGRRRRVVLWFRRATPLEDAAATAATGPSPSQRLDAIELRARAVRAIGRLTPKLRDALLLARSGAYDYEEIAAMLRIPVGTLKWRVSEARRKVREQLARDGYINVR